MKETRTSIWFKIIFGSVLFLTYFIGRPVFASNVEEEELKKGQFLLPMTIDYGTKSHMVYDETATLFALNVSQSAYGNPKIQSQWAQAYNENDFDSSLVIENQRVIMFRKNVEELDEKGNTIWTLTDLYSSVNTIIGVKTIEDTNGENIHLISVGFRGTDLFDIADIITDINLVHYLWNGSIHQGFYNTATAFYNMCDEIILDVNGEDISLLEIIDEMKGENSQYKMIVTGHSLGGAVADVFVGHTLRVAGVKEYNVTAYAFASPRSVTSSYANSANVKNIINIINNDDWVATQDESGQTYLGQTFAVTPNEQIREESYGDVYVLGKTSNQYATFWNFLNKKGMHDLSTYSKILIQVKDNINSYTTLNTVSGMTINNGDARIRDYSIQYINTDLNMGSGAKLTFDTGGKVYINGTVTQSVSSRLVVNNNSNVYIDGSYNVNMITGGSIYVDILSGKIEVGEDVSITGGNGLRIDLRDELIVHGDLMFDNISLGFNQPSSYIKVYGNCSMTKIWTGSGYNITQGTIEILGNCSSVISNGNVKVKLSGNTKQSVNASNFRILELANTSAEGVEFTNNINVYTLFNHNNLNYVLKNGGTFADYDGDTVKDNLDMYPTDSARY